MAGSQPKTKDCSAKKEKKMLQVAKRERLNGNGVEKLEVPVLAKGGPCEHNFAMTCTHAMIWTRSIRVGEEVAGPGVELKEVSA